MAETDYERFTAADGTSIAYWVTGDGSPVVLVHGYPVTSTTNRNRRNQGEAAGQPTDPALTSATLGAGPPGRPGTVVR